ncbi:hypothetical protein [Roseateles chitosanitabidus]|uniref:hypothetical protein n=1 Tax=Roseateles chitosanitabidus TaxID=65048 RepID=UPI00082E2E00|nr:hypothetical protein [Roseateles chitosanitabidus]
MNQIGTSTTQADISAARALVLRQVEFYSEWVFLQCRGIEREREVPHLRGVTAEDLADLKTPRLVVIQNDPGQPHITRCAAGDLITERFLADDDTQAEIIRIANKLAEYRLQADEQDRRERRVEHARAMNAPVLALVGSDA